MKHTFLKVSVLFCALSFAFSCSKDKDIQKPVGGDAGADVLLSLSDTDVHPLGDKFRVAYSSDSDWELTGVENKNWIDIRKKRGSAGTTVLDITVEPFLADSDTNKRDVSLSFRKSSDSSVEIFTISQRAAYIDLDSTSFSIDWHNDERAGAVESNIGWKISCDSDWITPSWSADWTSEAVDTAGVADITFIVGNNFSDRNNETKIVIEPVAPADYNLDDDVWSGVVAALKREISVSQNYLIFLLEESSDTKPFSELGADFVDANASAVADEHSVRQKITVYSETMDWDYSPDTSWIQASLNPEKNTEDAEKTEQYGRPIYKTEVEIEVIEPNPTDQVRSAEIVFSVKSNGESYDKSVRFSQNAYTLDVSESDCIFINNPADKDGDEKILWINTTGSWKIEDIPDWLEVSQTSGIGSAEVTLKPEDQNLNFNDPDGTNERNCTLKITTDGLNDSNFGAECKVSQDGFIFDVNWDDALNENLPRLNKDKYAVNIESSGEWKVTLSAGDGDNEKDDWLNVSSYVGKSGPTTITVQPNKANPNKDKSRTKKVTITSVLHDNAGIKDTNAVKTFPVTQDKHVFQIKKSDSEDAEDFVPEPFAAYEAASQKFVLRCSAPWKIEGMPDWMSVSSLSGTGEIYPTITLNTYDNSGKNYQESRSTTLNILSDTDEDGLYADKLTMTISQDAFVFDVKVDPDYDFQTSLSAISSDSYSLNINTTSGAGWNVSAPEWFVCSWDKGSGNGAVFGNSTADIDFSFANNGYLYSRTGEVRVSSEVVDTSYSFPVAQDAYIFDDTEYNFAEFDEIKSKAPAQQMTFDCLGAWTIESKPSWIGVSPASGSGNPVLSVTADATNASYGSRQGTVIVNSTVGGVTHRKNIAVSQRGYQWEVSGTEAISAPLDGDRQTVSIKSSGSWRASIVDRETSETADWVTVSPAEGNAGRDNVSTSEISVSKNYTTSNRKATVTFRSDDYTSSNRFSSEVSIDQEPYIFDVSELDDKITFNAISSLESGDFNVKSTGGFDNEDIDYKNEDSGWLDVIMSAITVEGISDIKWGISFKAAPNYTLASRSATVTLRSKDYSKNNELSKTIEVTQDAYEWAVIEKEELLFGYEKTSKSFDGFKSTGGFAINIKDKAEDWLTATISNGTLTLEATENTAYESRSATVEIKSRDWSHNNAFETAITVTQAAAPKPAL